MPPDSLRELAMLPYPMVSWKRDTASISYLIDTSQILASHGTMFVPLTQTT